MAVAAMLAGAVHQPLDLALGEVAPLDCQVYDAWGAFLGCRFHADKLRLRVSYCICYTPLSHSQITTLHDRLRDQPARRAHPTPGKAVCRIYGTQLASTIRSWCWRANRPQSPSARAVVSRRSEHEPAGGRAMNRGEPPSAVSSSKGCRRAIDPR